MISNNKKMFTKCAQKVIDAPIKPDLSKSGLPASYRRLLSLIFFSPDPLIHKASSHDKISS
jgi:hypothetical protein